jgi:5-deoxy-5-amino-3-dehydroquinate synthase
MAKYHFLTDEDLGDLPLAEKVARCVALKASFVSADEREDPATMRPTGGGEAARSQRPAAGEGPPPPGGGPGWGPVRGGEAARSRTLLNYGHTLGHALETAGHYDLRHGEAVAVGLVFAARLARRLGRIGDDRLAEHVAIVQGYGLPTTVPAGTDGAELIDLMAHDKKALDGFTFVLDGPRGLEVVTGVARADLEATLAEMEATPS